MSKSDESSTFEKWRERLEYLLDEESKAENPAQKFAIGRKIEEVEERLNLVDAVSESIRSMVPPGLAGAGALPHEIDRASKQFLAKSFDSYRYSLVFSMMVRIAIVLVVWLPVAVHFTVNGGFSGVAIYAFAFVFVAYLGSEIRIFRLRVVSALYAIQMAGDEREKVGW